MSKAAPAVVEERTVEVGFGMLGTAADLNAATPGEDNVRIESPSALHAQLIEKAQQRGVVERANFQCGNRSVDFIAESIGFFDLHGRHGGKLIARGEAVGDAG